LLELPQKTHDLLKTLRLEQKILTYAVKTGKPELTSGNGSRTRGSSEISYPSGEVASCIFDAIRRFSGWSVVIYQH